MKIVLIRKIQFQKISEIFCIFSDGKLSDNEIKAVLEHFISELIG